MTRKTKMLIMVAVLIVLLGAVLPVLTPPFNCGGNSAALTYTSNVATEVSLTIAERGTDSAAAFASLVPPSSWSEVFRFEWGVKSYWVRKEISPSETGPVVICAQCFDNVPQPTVWNLYHRNPGFAAGFLDGRARLLSMEEYNALDFNEYRLVDEDDVSG